METQKLENEEKQKKENQSQSITDRNKKRRTNPFEGPVDEDTFIVDSNGNTIKVPQGNWLTGTKDGKWIQERTPDGTTKGASTGLRKDGGHSPSPIHTDPRSLKPHAHVPEITNADGTPWLSIY